VKDRRVARLPHAGTSKHGWRIEAGEMTTDFVPAPPVPWGVPPQPWHPEVEAALLRRIVEGR
jgi:hypothetical protein